jgi:peptidoglycan/LPS O-acetylase OafA/YrhL
MNIVLEIHFVFAFLVLLVVLCIGWVQLGRRVAVTVIGIQVLIGVIVAAMAGMSHMALPSMLWLHILGGLLAMGAYIAGRRMLDRSPQNAVPAIVLSVVGLALVVFTIMYGSRMVHGG